MISVNLAMGLRNGGRARFGGLVVAFVVVVVVSVIVVDSVVVLGKNLETRVVALVKNLGLFVLAVPFVVVFNGLVVVVVSSLLLKSKNVWNDGIFVVVVFASSVVGWFKFGRI